MSAANPRGALLGGSLPRVGLALSSGGYGGGGGMTGFAAALELFLGSHPVSAIGNYSGVSAGSIVSSYLAAGISPLDIIKAIFGAEGAGFQPWRKSDMYRLNLGELMPTATRLARAALVRLGLRAPPGASELGLLPSSVMSPDALTENIRKNLEGRGVARFSDLARRLSIAFYDVLTNERVVAGNGPGEVDVAIVDAIAASAAIPGVFPPRRLQVAGRTMLGVDGSTGGFGVGVRDFDEAVDLIIVYNNSGFAPIANHVTHVSAPTVVGLSLQLQGNQANVDEVASWIDAHPEAHAWAFTPPPRSLKSTLSFGQLFEEARECFELGQRWLREHFDYFALVLANHGVTADPAFDRVTFDEVKARGAEAKRST